jgi:hypothetical protein
MIENSDEYIFTKGQLAGKSAKRSGVPYFTHVKEGLHILSLLPHMGIFDVDIFTEKAYCLHAVSQNDADLMEFYGNFHRFSSTSIGYAMEYRNVANRSLRTSFKKEFNYTEIILSPIPQVNYMLIADKIQNRKDFLKYYPYPGEHWDSINHYFNMWMKRLDVSEDFYEFAVNSIS